MQGIDLPLNAVEVANLSGGISAAANIGQAYGFGFGRRILYTAMPEMKTLDEVPGAEVAAIAGLNHKEAKILNEKWRVMRMVLKSTNKEDESSIIRAIKDEAGSILSIVPSSQMEQEVFVVFPNAVRASNAESRILSAVNASKIESIKIQKEGAIAGRLVYGKPAFFGTGIDNIMPNDKEVWTAEVAEIQPSDETLYQEGFIQDKASLKEIKAIDDAKLGIGGIAFVELPEYGGEGLIPAEKSQVFARILSIADEATDTVTWIGNRIVISSTTEAAARKCAEQLCSIVEECEVFKKAQYRIGIVEGEISAKTFGGGDSGPRVLSGDLFAVAKTLVESEAYQDGIFVYSETKDSMAREMRGAEIEFEEPNKGICRLLKVKARTTNIQVGGPKEMLGRDDLMHDIREAVGGIRTTGQGKVMVFTGQAGIGKSRLLEEIRGYTKRTLGDKADVAQTIAQQYEATKAYTFIKNFIGALLAENEDLKDTNAYVILKELADGKEGSLSLHSNPDTIVYLIVSLIMQSKKEVKELMTDDLQWCDDESAKILAMGTEHLHEQPNNRTLIVLVSRKGRQGMPAVLQMTLDAIEAQDCELKELPFKEDRQLLERYVAGSFKRDVKVGQLPPSFWEILADKVGGNPYALSAALYNMEARGALQIDATGNLQLVGEISIEDIFEQGLYQNMLNVCLNRERAVFKALRIFKGCRANEQLFRTLFHELDREIQTLIDSGLLVKEGDMLKPQHDLLREAIEERYEIDEEMAIMGWNIYEAISAHPDLAAGIDDETLYLLIKPAFKNIKVPGDTERRIARAALKHGMAAVEKYRKDHRYKDVIEDLELLLFKIKFQPEASYEHVQHLAEAALALGDSRRMQKYARGLHNSKGNDPIKEADALVVECDAYYLDDSREGATGLRRATEKLEERVSTLGTEHKEKYEFMLGLNKARCIYRELREGHREEDMTRALEVCNELMESEKDSWFDRESKEFALRRISIMPFDRAACYLEAKRFQIKLQIEIEKARREDIEPDAVYCVNPEENDAKKLSDIYKRSSRLLEIYEELKIPVVRRHKDILSARLAHAQVLGLLGTQKVDFKGHNTDARKACLRAAEDLARSADNFGERELGALAYKLKGDVALSEDNLDESSAEIAAEAYKKGCSITRKREDTEEHQYYRVLAGSVPMAVAEQVERSKMPNDKKLVLIKDAWNYACEAYDRCADYYALGQDRGAQAEKLEAYWQQIILNYMPGMARLRFLAAQLGENLRMPRTKKDVTPTEITKTIGFLKNKRDSSISIDERDPYRKKIEQKIRWLDTWALSPDDIAVGVTSAERLGRDLTAAQDALSTKAAASEAATAGPEQKPDIKGGDTGLELEEKRD